MSTDYDYETVGELLVASGVDLIPAEFQGQLTGLWCRATALPPDLGIAGVDPATVDWEPLRHYAAEVWRQLEDPACGYNLLLPDDTQPLNYRIDALAEWCDGLLYGIGHAGELDAAALSETVSEALADLTEIARVELDAEEGDENEQAYSEIVEYLRVLAQTLYVELHPPEKSPQDHEH